MKIKITLLFCLIVLANLFVLVQPVFAEGPVSTTIQLENPIGGQKDAGLFGPIVKIVKNSMFVMGALALAAFVYGGFNWLISMGNAEKVKTGTNTMVWAVIGLFLIFSSYAILKLITDALGGL
jgi:hypothetical protein